MASTKRRADILFTEAVDAQILRRIFGNTGTLSNPSAPVTGPWAARSRPGISFEQFQQIYRILPLPPAARLWSGDRDGLSDELFAWLRIAGPNPEMLQGIERLPDGFPANLPLPGGDTAEAAAKRGELFLADYRELETLENSMWHELPRYVCAPRVLFAVVTDQLVPVAIQCETGGPVVLRGTDDWALAKHVVQVADANYHELISHLGRTHLLVEIFLMATRRNLACNHPVHRLLVPHFEGTVFINVAARGDLIAPGGAIDEIFAGTIESSKKLAIHSLASLDVSAYDLPSRILDRKTQSIRCYPWRDDALRIWEAIEDFVLEYVQHYYPTPDAIRSDPELTAWSDALSEGVENGGVPGFRRPTEAESLARLLTLVVYTASAQHAAVNFTQYPLMSFAPMTSGAGWAPPPAAAPAGTSIYEFLPPRQLANKQVAVLNLLSAVHYTQLGQYDRSWFRDVAVDQFARKLQLRLKEIETEIEHANLTRRAPYTHLLPSLIPQSINI